MKIKVSYFLAVASTVFALGAFSQTKTAHADACPGGDSLCAGSCTKYCNVSDPKDCFWLCPSEPGQAT